MWLTDKLEDWISTQIDEGYQYRGIQLRLTTIKSFLHAFRLKPTPTIDINIKEVKEDVKYRLTVEDIRKAIKNSKPTYQAIFTLQSQTGLAIADVVSLNIEDFIAAVTKKSEKLTLKQAIYKVRTDEQLIGCFDMRRKKTSNQFYTFIGHEALLGIAELLNDRTKYITPNSPIFLRETSHIPRELKDKDFTAEEYEINHSSR